MTTKKTRREFTDEFKREAVVLLRDSGQPLTQVASELGLEPSVPRGATHARARHPGTPAAGVPQDHGQQPCLPRLPPTCWTGSSRPRWRRTGSGWLT